MQKSLLTYYKKNKRDLPWRKTSDPYKIWVSEIFLQQTQVSRVIDFYTRFIEKFPTVKHLSQSSWEEFVPYFQGLGFYSRGRNMLKTAQKIETEFSGKFPENKPDLEKLPGIGNYTSSAILSFAYQQNFPAFDVNLYRVLGRFFGYNDSELKQKTNKNYKYILREIEQKAEKLFYTEDEISGKNSADVLNHAFMDLGASLCTAKKVECESCPLQKKCKFFLGGKILHKQKKTKNTSTGSVSESISVMVLHHEKKYFLIQNPENSGTWKFPEFSHDEIKIARSQGGVPTKTKIKKIHHRHFLQEKSLLNFGIEISVRPPFLKQVISEKNSENSEENLYLFSRCQILRGEFFPEILGENQGRFFTKAEISELLKHKNIPEKFSGMCEEVLQMRI